jgi:hypothetical protein
MVGERVLASRDIAMRGRQQTEIYKDKKCKEMNLERFFQGGCDQMRCEFAHRNYDRVASTIQHVYFFFWSNYICKIMSFLVL